MERSLLSAVIGGVLGVAGSLGIVGAAVSRPPNPEPAAPEANWRLLDPITYENIAIFPVVANSGINTSSFVTLDEALSSGDVVVSEQGASAMYRDRNDHGIYVAPPQPRGASVNQLVLVNRGKRLVILLAGELVSGGKQDRIIAKDRIVAPGSDPLPLDVFCVEHGRWSAGSKFVESKTIVHPSVREQAAMKQDQNEVWSAVMRGSMAKAAPTAPAATLSAGDISTVVAADAPTQSYDKIYNSRRVSGSVETLVDTVQRRFAKATSGLKGERVVGVIVAYGGEVAWSDIFASSDLFEQYWPKLLRSYAVEALARPTLRETASAADAREFLQRPSGREIQESEPGVYRRREVTEGSLSLIELDALQPKAMTLHRLLVHRTS
jgi:hypothetical protein